MGLAAGNSLTHPLKFIPRGQSNGSPGSGKRPVDRSADFIVLVEGIGQTKLKIKILHSVIDARIHGCPPFDSGRARDIIAAHDARIIPAPPKSPIRYFKGVTARLDTGPSKKFWS